MLIFQEGFGNVFVCDQKFWVIAAGFLPRLLEFIAFSSAPERAD